MSEQFKLFSTNPSSPVDVLRNAPTQPEWRHLDAGHIATLASELTQRIPHPLDALEITAVLESLGITDEIAARRYGARDVFELADAVLAHLKATGLSSVSEFDEPPRGITYSRRQALLDYSRGVLALVPIVVMLMLIWTYTKLDRWGQSQVLALTLGMTGSMLITSGFIQAVSRRGGIFLGLGNVGAASRFLRASVVGTGIGIVGVAALVFVVTARLGWFTPQDRLIFTLALVGLSIVWLMGAVLGLVQAPGWLGAGLVAGLITGHVVDRSVAPYSELHLVIGTAAGFIMAMGLMLLAVRHALWAIGSGQSASRVVLPPVAYMVHEAAPYFAYGSLYMVFILLPHALGWMGTLGNNEERLFAVNNLEVGMTLSLAPLILVSGVAEHAARLFWGHVPVAQAAASGENPGEFGHSLAAFYRRSLKHYLIVLAVASIVTEVGMQVALGSGLLTSWVELTNPGIMNFVFQASLMAYFLLGWGVFNCMFSVALARPEMALRAVKLGMATTIITGVPLAVGVNYSYAVVAFIAGTLAFVLASSWVTHRVFESADYYYFSLL